jgi:hypothetical protein
MWNWHTGICSATAQDIRTMIIGRLLAGIGIGVSSALVPLYISEVAIRWNDSCFVQNLMLLWYVLLLVLMNIPNKWISCTLQISPTEIRGTLGTVNQLFICIGILAALLAGLPLAGNPAW